MSIPVVVMGAAGRMGKAVTTMLEDAAGLHLAGLVEKPDRLSSLAVPGGIPASGSLDEVLAQLKEPVVIDFTSPESSLAAARSVVRHGASQVIGTTGLTAEQRSELEGYAREARIFWSPNMSVGINVLIRILPELVRMLGESYDMEVMEIHHNKKKDAPSGTALRLAEVLAEARGWDLQKTGCCCREGITGERPHQEIGLQSLRGGDMVGLHTAYFFGQGERIEVTHQAHSRNNFAAGALRAATWLADQEKGRLYTMQDIF